MNVLAVRVRNAPQPNTRWYSGSGIYRHVWLHVTAPVHVVPHGVFVTTTELSPIHVTLRAETTVRNDSKEPQAAVVETSIRNADNRTVAFARSELTLPPGSEATVANRSPLERLVMDRATGAAELDLAGSRRQTAHGRSLFAARRCATLSQRPAPRRKSTTRAEQFKATFAVRFAPGTLRAVGVQGGREVESFQLKTAGAPAALRLTSDRARLRSDGQDLSFVTVEVVEAQGRLVQHADLAARFALTGPAAMAGIGSGDLASRESYQANPRRVYARPRDRGDPLC